MRVAVTQRIQQDGKWRDGDTSFLRVNVWRGPSRAPGRVSGQGRPGDGHRAAAPAQLGDPEGEKRSVAEIEADEVGATLKFATAKVERATERGSSDRNQGGERQAERSGDFNDQPEF